MESSFCGQCGTAIPATNKFCTKCGTPSGFHKAITPEMAAEARSADTSEQPTAAIDTADDYAEPALTASSPAADAPLRASEPEIEEPTVRLDSAAAPPPPPPGPSHRSSSSSGRGPGRWVAVGGAAAALVAVAVVAIVLLTGGGDDAPVGNPEQAATGVSADTAYQEQVAKAFGPVLGANQQVSARLEALKGTKPDSARRAVQQAKEATTAARGALSALSVPDTQSALATNAVQVIDRQEAYLTAVESVLGHPTVAGAAQLQTLSSNLISAFHTAGPAVAGETQTVSGADRLETWARTTRATLNKRAKAKREKAKRAREQSGSGSGSSTPAAPRGESCGDGVYAGPNTSCSFAFNVRDAYNGAPGAAATVRVYSPVTNQTYTMNCRPSGTGITCSGGNNASVTF